MDLTKLSFDLWYEAGLRNGFIGPVVCYTHDTLPMDEEEDNEFIEGYDPCIWIIRKYDSPEHKHNVEENHPPSKWRNHICDRG